MSPAPGSHGGRGSNQYQTRGQPAVPPRRTDTTDTAAAVTQRDPELVAVAFEPGGLAAWRQYGITDPEIALWHAAGFTPSLAVRWLAVGADDPQTIPGEHPGFLLEWADHGLPAADAQTWADAGFRASAGYPDAFHDAIVWASAGYDPETAAHWRGQGFAGPAELDAYAARQGLVTPPDRQDTASLSQALADALDTKGFVTRPAPLGGGWEAAAWAARRGGVTDPDVLANWRTAAAIAADDASGERFEPQDVPVMHHAGVTPEYAKELWEFLQPASSSRHDFAKCAAYLWRSGHTTAGDAATAFAWVFDGTTAGAAGFVWWGGGLTDPAEIERWDQALPGTAPRRAQAAVWWNDHGYQPHQAQIWEQYCQLPGRTPFYRRIAAFLDARGVPPQDLNPLLSG